MKFPALIASAGEWLRADGPPHDIVFSSRIRLARNLRRHPFPGHAKKVERVAALDRIKPAIEQLPEMEDAFSESLQDLTQLEKQVLVERHLISREHAAKGVGSAVVMNRQQTLSIMVNEEDHLRMQAIRVGFQLHNAYATLEKVDGELEELLDFAFNEQLGYLTACPTNVGTGMRASAMLHLPALVLKEEINKVIQSVNKIGLAVRGLYGEGTEAMGNLFQISNQTTLGEKEEDIIGRLAKVIEKIIEAEQNMRETLMQSHQTMLADQVGRAYGILSNAHSMTSKEALNLLSVIRMGVDLAILPSACRLPVDELFMETQPAHLQKNSPQPKLSAEERDALRADIVRGRLRGFPTPDLSKVLPAGGHGANGGNGTAEKD